MIAARFTDFLVGRSAEYAAAKKPSTAKSSLDRCKMLPLATQMCQLNVALGGTLGARAAQVITACETGCVRPLLTVRCYNGESVGRKPRGLKLRDSVLKR